MGTRGADTGRDRLAGNVWVIPRDGMGKGSRLFTAGREWKVGSHLVDGTGWEYTDSWREGIVERIGNRSGTSAGNRLGT